MAENRFQCSVCRRYFKNLEGHRRNRHPDSRLAEDIGQLPLGSIAADATPKPKTAEPEEAAGAFKSRRGLRVVE